MQREEARVDHPRLVSITPFFLLGDVFFTMRIGLEYPSPYLGFLPWMALIALVTYRNRKFPHE